MNILAIHGSPRAKGNTDAILERYLTAVRQAAGAHGTEPQIEHIYAERLKARPCLHCGGCDETGECVVKDDMHLVYAAVRKADAIVVATPVFFATLTAQLKTVIDRFQCAWAAKYRLGRPWIESAEGRRAVLLCAGGMTVDRHFQQVRGVLRAWLAVLNVGYAGGLWFPGVDARGDSDKIHDLEGRLAEAAGLLLAEAGSDE